MVLRHLVRDARNDPDWQDLHPRELYYFALEVPDVEPEKAYALTVHVFNQLPDMELEEFVWLTLEYPKGKVLDIKVTFSKAEVTDD